MILLPLLLAFGPAQPAAARPGWSVAAPLKQLGFLARELRFGAVYDGSGPPTPAAPSVGAQAPALPAIPSVGPLSSEQRLREAKSVLDDGDLRLQPFVFHPGAAPQAVAPGSGLEGFLYEERSLEKDVGRQALLGQLGDYGRYLDTLLSGVDWTEEGRGRIAAIEAGPGTDLEKYGLLMDFVARYTEELREAVAAADRSAWVRKARIYEIFPRAYNLAGRRTADGGTARLEPARFFADFGDRDLASIRSMGFDTLWIMGLFPIGVQGRQGTAGGSPYSIQDYETVNPELGTPEQFKALVARAHRQGLRVLIDFVANHTSLDSKLLAEDPDYFIHRPAGDGPPPQGMFERVDPATGQRLWISHGGYDSYGTLAFWEDTAQLDYSNPRLRRWMIQVAELWARDYRVDGFRVDMAYQLLNRYFSRNWKRAMPRREFLEELATEIKAKVPGTAFIAEAYDGFDELSRAGFDLVYSKNDIARPGGHAGWYDALVSRDPAWIRRAIRREAYLDWQEGGAEGLPFVGNHDEAAPRRALGPWMEGATFLTLMKPGSLLFYGSAEIGFDRPSPHDAKPLPFDVPVQIDWAHPDPEIQRFHRETFALARELRGQLGDCDLDPLPEAGEPRWVGYLLLPRRPASLKAAAVLANPTPDAIAVRFSEPSLGIEYQGELPPLGYRLIRF